MFTDVLQVLNRFEIDEDLGRNNNVKGNLKKNLEFWVFLGASSFILNVIKFGYRLPFWDVPPAYYSKNNASALKNIDFVENSITELLKSERIKQLSYKPHVVNPLSVSVQPNGKKRLILDLRYVNHFIKKLRIKYDDWKIASLMFRKNGYMFSFDLKEWLSSRRDLPTTSNILRFFMGVSRGDAVLRFHSSSFWPFCSSLYLLQRYSALWLDGGGLTVFTSRYF